MGQHGVSPPRPWEVARGATGIGPGLMGKGPKRSSARRKVESDLTLNCIQIIGDLYIDSHRRPDAGAGSPVHRRNGTVLRCAHEGRRVYCLSGAPPRISGARGPLAVEASLDNNGGDGFVVARYLTNAAEEARSFFWAGRPRSRATPGSTWTFWTTFAWRWWRSWIRWT
jgi:hypothetical protein